MRAFWNANVHAIVLGVGAVAGLTGCSAKVSGEGAETTSSEELRTAGDAREAGDPSAAKDAGPSAGTCGTRYVAVAGDATPANDCRAASSPCVAIQHAVDVACPGDTVQVGEGTFDENVVVDKALTVLGSGDATVVVPAVSNPNPCSDSSLCGGAASSVFLVRAASVTLEHFAIDGDNPALTSGAIVGSADVDARNGVITDETSTFDDLTVRDVTVRNVFLRGIDAASGGTFRIERSRVSNLSADPEAIGIFNTGGAGTIADNVVTSGGACIAANFSRGVRFARNRVTGCGAGIHTDNAGGAAGSSADVIEDNLVTACAANGYGVFVFVPSLGVTVRGNRVTGCTVGLAAFGEGAAVQSRFVGNRIDARGVAESTGLYVTTSQVGFGSNDVDVLVARNAIEGAAVGVLLEQEPGFKTTASLECNALTDDAKGLVTESTTATVEHNVIAGGTPGVDATAVTGTFAAPNNFWGCPKGPGATGCSTVTPNVDSTPAATTPPLCTFFL
jgi:hypothetical protein